MRNAFVQRSLAVLLCAAVGCQGGPGLLSPRGGKAPALPVAGGDGESKPAGRSPLTPPPPGADSPAVSAAGPPSQAPAAPVRQVAFQAPGGPASADATVTGGTAQPAGAALDGSATKEPQPAAEFVRSLVPGSEPTFYLESALMRGQTPLRDFFVSDRFIAASIIIAAVVIPFAIHDSRQPLPPIHGTQ